MWTVARHRWAWGWKFRDKARYPGDDLRLGSFTAFRDLVNFVDADMRLSFLVRHKVQVMTYASREICRIIIELCSGYRHKLIDYEGTPRGLVRNDLEAGHFAGLYEQRFFVRHKFVN